MFENVMQGILGAHVRTDVRFSVLQAQTGCNFLGQVTDRLILKKTENLRETRQTEVTSPRPCHMILLNRLIELFSPIGYIIWTKNTYLQSIQYSK